MITQFYPLWLHLGEYVLRIVLGVAVLLHNRRTPAVRLAWLVVVFGFPLAGFVLYLLVGEVRLGRGRLARYRRLVARDRASREPGDGFPPSLDRREALLASLAMEAGGAPPRTGHDLRLFGDSAACIDALVADIDAATVSCDLLFYAYLTDGSGSRVAEALARAAGRGVQCRLMADAAGSHAFLRSPLRRTLASAGVRVVPVFPGSPARPLLARIDVRNHRKIAVIDGRVGYTGSQNIADAAFAPKKAFAPWVDAVVRLEGPSVRDLRALFEEDWCANTGVERPEITAGAAPPDDAGGATVQVIGSGPHLDSGAFRQMLQALCHLGTDELIMTTPYFVPDDATLGAILGVARAGVPTTLVVPARNDSPLVALASRSFYEPLLEAGVRLLEFRHGLLHAKTLTVNGALSLISSANLDRRSFEINFEVSAIVYDRAFTARVRALQMTYAAQARPIEPASWRARSAGRRLAQNAAGLLAPIL